MWAIFRQYKDCESLEIFWIAQPTAQDVANATGWDLGYCKQLVHAGHAACSVSSRAYQYRFVVPGVMLNRTVSSIRRG